MIVQTHSSQDLLRSYDSKFDFIDKDNNYSLFYKINSFLQSTSSTAHISSYDTLFTPGLIYSDNSTIVYEKPPTNKNIFYINQQVDSIDEESEEHIYTLPIPWQVYVITYSKISDDLNLNNVYMYFSNTSIRSLDQPVYLPPLPNLYSNGELCRPMFDSMEDITPDTNDINGLIQLSYNWVWNSGSNADLTESILQTMIYSKARNKRLFPKLSNMICSTVNPIQNYYTPYATEVFSAWEKLSLTESIEVEWFPPCSTSRYVTYYSSHYNDNYSNWIEQNPQHLSSSDACCEDCQYYDDDGEMVEDHCTEEGQCRCHESSSSLDSLYQMMRDTGAFDREVTLRECIKQLAVSSPVTRNSIDFLSHFYHSSLL